MQPLNSKCENAVVLSEANGYSYTGTTVGAPTEAVTCSAATSMGSSNMGDGMVWATIIGTGERFTTKLSQIEGDYAKIIAVSKGSCGSQECVGHHDTFHISNGVVTWISEPGVTYYIQVYDYGFHKSGGSFKLDVERTSVVSHNEIWPSGTVHSLQR